MKCNKALLILMCAGAFILAASWSREAFAQKAEDYFPLFPGIKYTYLGAYKEETYRETIITREFTKANLKLIYFIDESDLTKPDSIIGSNMIGLGAYTNGTQGIYTYECFWTNDLYKVSSSKPRLLFHNTLKKGDSLRFTSDDGKRAVVISVMGFESTSVPAGIFRDTVKIQIQEISSDKTYDGYAWFAKGIGMVKRVRGTGRVDALISYSNVSGQRIAWQIHPEIRPPVGRNE